jgi:AcrR family transcriptional regulator
VKRAGLTQDLLVGAAADLADEDGLAAVTVSALARRFGVQPASVYSHVSGLDGLLDETAELVLQEVSDLLAEALVGRSGRGALFAFADTQRDYARAHPGRWQLAQRRFTPERAATSAGVKIAHYSRAIMSDYGLTPDDEVHAVRLLGSAINGFVALEAGGGFDHSHPPAADSWARVLGAIDGTLRHWPASATSTRPRIET